MSKNRFFLDTEFIDDGKTIELLSIGIASDSGATYYAESSDADHSKASEWVKENVLPHLGKPIPKPRSQIAKEIIAFVDMYYTSPSGLEFWGYFADYDWVVFCQLFGTMMDLPRGWPMYCNDIKQLCNSLGNPRLPKQEDVTRGEHHALGDALWNMTIYNMLIDGVLTSGG